MEWINPEEQLPEHGQTVFFITKKDNAVKIGFYYKNQHIGAQGCLGTFRVGIITNNERFKKPHFYLSYDNHQARGYISHTGYHCWSKKDHTEVKLWQPLNIPEIP